MEYRALNSNPRTKELWNRSAANEFGRLAQGVGNRIVGTDTIFFIRRSQVPRHKKATYPRFVVSYRGQKAEPERTRLTVGGNLIDYAGDVSTRTADMTSFKLLANSTISTPGARFSVIDIKNFYLGTPMDEYEYM